jgi:hypothetical protein
MRDFGKVDSGVIATGRQARIGDRHHRSHLEGIHSHVSHGVTAGEGPLTVVVVVFISGGRTSKDAQAKLKTQSNQ